MRFIERLLNGAESIARELEKVIQPGTVTTSSAPTRAVVREVNKRSEELPTDWTYSHLKNYLLALSRGLRVLLPQGEYPATFELNVGWHSLMNEMRRGTIVDGLERWGLVGVKSTRDAIFLSKSVFRGTGKDVPASVISDALDNARNDSGIVFILGDIHSHPNKGDSANGFSPADLFLPLEPGRSFNFVGLVTKNKNIFAFRSRETLDVPIPPALRNQMFFNKFWCEQCGLKYVGDYKSGNGVWMETNPFVSFYSINKRISETYKYVLYHGAPGGKLVRVYPEI